MAGAGVPRVVRLDAEQVTIGREAATLTVDDGEVSRRHATVSRRGGAFVLEDQASANGTRCNLLPVTAPVLLENGDLIVVGGAAIGFWVVSSDAAIAEAQFIEATAKREAALRILFDALAAHREGRSARASRLARKGWPRARNLGCFSETARREGVFGVVEGRLVQLLGDLAGDPAASESTDSGAESVVPHQPAPLASPPNPDPPDLPPAERARFEAAEVDDFIELDVRLAAWRRDRGYCQHCASEDGLKFQRILPLEKGGARGVGNVVLICARCRRTR